MKALKVIVIALSLSALSPMTGFSATAAASLSEDAPVVTDIHEMIHESALITSRLYHDPPESDKARLEEMASELADIEGDLEARSTDNARRLALVARALREASLMTKDVVHAYPPHQKARLEEFRSELNSEMLELNVLLLRGGGTGLDETVYETMGVTGEFLDVIIEMKHTVPTRAEKKRLGELAERVEGMME